MSNLIVSENQEKAMRLHQRIIVSAQMAQTSLADMCMSLREMRDSKLYKELGYDTFEAYSETEIGMDRRHAYRYIQIAEKFENVTPVSHLGVSKLYLLSTLPEEDRQEVMENTDVEKVSKRELEKAISDLKAEKAKIRDLKDQLMQTEAELEQEKSKPVEVAVVEPDPAEIARLVAERVKEIEEKAQSEIAAVRSEAEKKAVNVDVGKEIFKAYYKSAYDAFARLLEFAGTEEAYLERIRMLLKSLEDSIQKTA